MEVISILIAIVLEVGMWEAKGRVMGEFNEYEHRCMYVVVYTYRPLRTCMCSYAHAYLYVFEILHMVCSVSYTRMHMCKAHTCSFVYASVRSYKYVYVVLSVRICV